MTAAAAAAAAAAAVVQAWQALLMPGPQSMRCHPPFPNIRYWLLVTKCNAGDKTQEGSICRDHGKA